MRKPKLSNHSDKGDLRMPRTFTFDDIEVHLPDGSTISPLGPMPFEAKTGGRPEAPIDPDAQAYIDAMVVKPDAARTAVINQFFLDIKGIGNFGIDNLFAKLDFLYLCAAHTEQVGLLDIRRGTPFDATAVNSPTFVADRGFTGGVGKYLDTGFVPKTDGVNFLLNDASLIDYSRTNIADDTKISIGSQDSGVARQALGHEGPHRGQHRSGSIIAHKRTSYRAEERP